MLKRHLTVLLVTFAISGTAFAQRSEERVYLLPSETDPLVSVYRNPGQNWKYPLLDKTGKPEEAVGWLDSNSKIWTTGEKKTMVVRDPFTNELVEETYYKIKFEYEREYLSNEVDPKTKQRIKKILRKTDDEKDVWIDAAYISTEKVTDHPYLQSPPKFEICTKEDAKSLSLDKRFVENLTVKGLDDAVKEIFPKIGMCTSLKEAAPGGNLYDNAILNKIREAGAPKAIAKSDGSPVTPEDLVEIDSLARTIYGEMASCFRHGVQYPMAVARIAMNRVEFSKKLEEDNKNRKKKVTDPFIQGPHNSQKTHLSKVVTSPIQFNAWLRKLNSKKNPSMDMALCPARDPKQKLLDGRMPGPQELAVWKSSVKIASDAVLNRKEFLAKTDGVKDIKNYTSAMGQFYGMKQQKGRKIAGLEIKKDSCVELWKD